MTKGQNSQSTVALAVTYLQLRVLRLEARHFGVRSRVERVHLSDLESTGIDQCEGVTRQRSVSFKAG